MISPKTKLPTTRNDTQPANICKNGPEVFSRCAARLPRRDGQRHSPAMIVLFTDFGLAGPYTGQVRAVLHETAPLVPVIQLFADAPAGQPKPAAYLLAALPRGFPRGRCCSALSIPGSAASGAA